MEVMDRAACPDVRRSWSGKAQHSHLAVCTGAPGNKQTGKLVPRSNVFVQVFGCAPRAWWDVAPFQVPRSSLSSVSQLDSSSEQGPEGKTMLGVQLGVYLEGGRGPITAENLHPVPSDPCVRAALQHRASCQSCRSRSQEAHSLTGICLVGFCLCEFKMPGQNWL